MIQRRSRLPAVLMLLGLLAFGAGVVFARRSAAFAGQSTEIAQLGSLVSKGNASPETWLRYGKALQANRQYAEAAVAFEQVLKGDPYQREARLQCSVCRAAIGDKDAYYKFMHDTVELDPKLAKSIFERPEAAPFLAEARFVTLRIDAVNGSQD